MSFFESKKLACSYARYPYLWLFFLLLSVIPAGRLATNLTIQSDFKNLLPDKKPSVVALDRIVEKVGGVENLLVGIESKDPKATIRFIDDLVVKLKELPEEYVRYVDYSVSEAKEFYSENRYLYIDNSDLKEIHDRLAKKIRYEKLNQNPFFIALEEDSVEFDLSDIEEKYKGETSKYDGFTDGYFFGENGRLAAIIIQPSGSSTGIGFAKRLLKKIQSVIDDLNPKSYSPTLKVHLVGKYQQILDEYAQLIRDILKTLGLCLFLVALIIYLYFFRVRVILLLTSTLGIGVLWTFGLTELNIGYLNTQTAFLGSIVVGNGVNSGIILLARYIEERRKCESVEDSLITSVSKTWQGTGAAAITTSAAFAALSFSEIRGFNQFGFIGGLGMIFCWISTYTFLPPMLVLSERIMPMINCKKPQSQQQWEGFLAPVTSMVLHSPRVVAGFGLSVAIFCGVLAAKYLPNSLEYDFSKLKNKPTTASGVKSVKDRIRDNIFQQNTSPSVILLEDESQAEYVCDAVMSMENSFPDHEKTVESCKTLHSYLPTDQKAKLVTLKKIRNLLEDRSINFLKPSYLKELEEFRKQVDLKEVGLASLPEALKRSFREKDGALGRVVFVYPRIDARLSNGKKLIQFAEVLSDVRLEDGSSVRMSGQAAIFADLLKAVIHDGPLATLFSFIAVALLVIINFRRSRPIIYILGGLIVGILYMLGLQAILAIKLNFFNFIALPVTFGIGVDYGVNLLQRYRFEGRGSMRRVLGTVGGAIVLCSMTTIIGYATLLTAQNQALASFGWLALMGEFACLFAGIVVMPALLHSFDRRHLRTVTPPAMTGTDGHR